MSSFKIQHREFEPPEALRDSIKCFWHDRRDFGDAQQGFEVVPDGYAEIIFYFGGLCGVSGDEGPLASPFIMGLQNRPVHFYAKDRLEIIGIRCYPWTVFGLLGLPSGKEVVRIAGHPIAHLQVSLAESVRAGSIDEALKLVERYCLQARSQVAMDSMLHKAGVAMRKANGTIPVCRIAVAAHTTVRTLERKFKQSSGYSVKDVSGLMRFEQVRNQLWLDPDSSIAGLAHEMGYTDQSHLSREFKRYTGTTPAAFARNAKKRNQLGNSDFVAFVQA